MGKRGTRMGTSMHYSQSLDTMLVIAVKSGWRNFGWEGKDGESISNHETIIQLLEWLTNISEFVNWWQMGVILSQSKGCPRSMRSHVSHSKDEIWGGFERYGEGERAASCICCVLPDFPLHFDGEHSRGVNFMDVLSRKKNFAATDGGDYAMFMTNQDEVSPDEAIRLTSQYSPRWDIENEYRSIKAFLPSIASTDRRKIWYICL